MTFKSQMVGMQCRHCGPRNMGEPKRRAGVNDQSNNRGEDGAVLTATSLISGVLVSVLGVLMLGVVSGTYRPP